MEAELVREAWEESLATEHFMITLPSVALTSDRECRFIVEHGDVVVVEVGLSVYRTGGQVVVSLNDWHRLAEVQLLPAVGSTARGVADTPAIFEDRRSKSLQEESLVLALVSF